MKFLALMSLIMCLALPLFAGAGAASAAGYSPPQPGWTLSVRKMYYKALHYQFGSPPNFVKAIKWYRKAAAAGNSYSMTDIGMLYGAGQGVPQDNSEAMQWFRKAAESPNPEVRQTAEKGVKELQAQGH